MKNKHLLPWEWIEFKRMPGGKWARRDISQPRDDMSYVSVMRLYNGDRWYYLVYGHQSRLDFASEEEAMNDCDMYLKRHKYQFIKKKLVVMI